MHLKEFLAQVAYVAPNKLEGCYSPTYYSKFDDSYMCLTSMPEKLQWMADAEITEELTHGVGFSPKDNKWWGWSHRAAYGFTVGSTCEQGDCTYKSATPEDLIEARCKFFEEFGEDYVALRRAECQVLEDRSGIRILTQPIDMPVVGSAEELIEVLDGEKSPEIATVFKESYYTVKCGRGAWTAKTLADAKLMAIDFNESVS